MEKTRRCLACKGVGYKYDYSKLKFTGQRCSCCKEGRVPFLSNDDGYGPFQFVQHALTTELKRGSYVVGKTTDIHGPPDNIPVEDIAVRLDGVFTVAELEGLASMIHKLREAGKKVNCQCCKWFIKTGS